MKLQKAIAWLITAAALQAMAVPLQAQDLFKIAFHANSPFSNNGNTQLTDKDLITECVGTETNTKNFSLVFNVTDDKIQVVNNSDGSVVCDVFLFQGGDSTINGNTLQRIAFMFLPGGGDSVGSAVITERANGNNSNNNRINGTVQFSFPEELLNGNGNGNNGTNDNNGNNGDNGNDNASSFVQTGAADAATDDVAIFQGTFNSTGVFKPKASEGKNKNKDQGGSQPKGSAKNDSKFVQKAAQGNMLEIAIGELAIQNSTDPAIVAYGQELINDHTAANNQLADIAAANGFDFPTTLDKNGQKAVNKLAGAKPEHFDKAFLQKSISVNQSSIKSLQKEADKTQNADLETYATDNIPVQQTHVAEAQDLESQIEQ